MTTFSLKLIRWQTVILLVMALTVFVGVTWLSVSRYWGYNSAMLDLGNMSQAIWSVLQGEPLIYTAISGPNSRIASHAEIIYYLLAPLYSLFPSPITLLIIQSILFVAGCVPLYQLALRRLDDANIACVLAITYLTYPVALTAALFDLHGDTLAMPFLIFALDALDRRATGRYFIWLLLALSCKVYVAIPVIVLGVVIWLTKRRRIAAFTCLAGVVWLLFIYFLRSRIVFAGMLATTVTSTLGYVNTYYGNLESIWDTLLLRILCGIVALAPAILLGIRAWLWMIPGLVVMLGVLTSTGSGPVYNYNSQHYALVVPFLMISMVYGAENLRNRKGGPMGLRVEGGGDRVSPREILKSRKGIQWIKKKSSPRSWRSDVVFTLILTALFSLTFLQTPQNPVFLFYEPKFAPYAVESRDAVTDQWIASNVPEEVPLLADMYLATHLTNRETLYTSYYTNGTGALVGERLSAILGEVDYVVFDVFSLFARIDTSTIKGILESPRFSLQNARDGLLLFNCEQSGLQYNIQVLDSVPSSDALVNFDNEIGLLSVDIESLAPRRYRMKCDWVALSPLESEPFMFAVSRLDGVENTRIVHLPSLAIFPTTSWPEGRVIREELVFQVPDDVPPGEYILLLGWYDSGNMFDFATDERSRVGEEVRVGNVSVP